MGEKIAQFEKNMPMHSKLIELQNINSLNILYTGDRQRFSNFITNQFFGMKKQKKN